MPSIPTSVLMHSPSRLRSTYAGTYARIKRSQLRVRHHRLGADLVKARRSIPDADAEERVGFGV